MIKYKYQDPSGEYIITREEILKQYYTWWCEQMRKVNKESEISEEACIQDFIIVHWAWEIKEEENANHPRGNEHV